MGVGRNGKGSAVLGHILLSEGGWRVDEVQITINRAQVRVGRQTPKLASRIESFGSMLLELQNALERSGERHNHMRQAEVLGGDERAVFACLPNDDMRFPVLPDFDQ